MHSLYVIMNLMIGALQFVAGLALLLMCYDLRAQSCPAWHQVNSPRQVTFLHQPTADIALAQGPDNAHLSTTIGSAWNVFTCTAAQCKAPVGI